MDSRKAERYGFASLAAVHYAHIAARKLAGKSPKGTNITLSPNPKDIVSLLWCAGTFSSSCTDLGKHEHDIRSVISSETTWIFLLGRHLFS